MGIDLANPHATLGAHPQDGGVVVRALRPEAASVRVVPQGVALQHVEGGVWEGVVRGAELPLDYELEVSYPGGKTFTVRDPYAFLPTVGELDLHLIAEGKHERLWDVLGAHPREVDGVTGTAFAVW